MVRQYTITVVVASVDRREVCRCRGGCGHGNRKPSTVVWQHCIRLRKHSQRRHVTPRSPSDIALDRAISILLPTVCPGFLFWPIFSAFFLSAAYRVRRRFVGTALWSDWRATHTAAASEMSTVVKQNESVLFSSCYYYCCCYCLCGLYIFFSISFSIAEQWSLV